MYVRDLCEHVTVTGEAVLQESLPALLQSARLFALPCVKDSEGDMDGLPQVLIESMACGVPAVSTFLVGIPDLIRHQENGLLVETGDVEACANAMQLLLHDDALLEEYGRRAQVAARAHFGRDKLANRLEEIFAEAMESPGTDPPQKRLLPAPGSAACYEQPRFSTRSDQARPSREPTAG